MTTPNEHLFRFNNLDAVPGISHFISMRKGGVSQGPYATLNLGMHTDDGVAPALANRMILASWLDLKPSQIITVKQVHSGEAVAVVNLPAGKGFLDTGNPVISADALITALPGVCVMVLVADCVPVLLCDPVKKVVAAIHAGWRGTVKQIVKNTILKMQSDFGCSPSDLIAGIGPSIGPCCYEVGNEVVAEAEAAFGNVTGHILYQEADSKPHFDLWYSNQYQLLQAGVKQENIETAGTCTLCNSGEYFSSRAGKGITGRFGAGIFLIP